MAESYDHQTIEKKWRKVWQDEKVYEIDPSKAAKPFYCLDMFPYPSGDGLHVGHWRGYVLSDFYARYYRLRGYDVLHPMGFDAFGLPSENAAIKHKSQPQKFTDQAQKTFTRQLDEIGAAYDWSKLISTADPAYYHWTQWIFLRMFKHGLAEKRTSLVNWCPNDQTVLANEQVVNGHCERCGAKVTKKNLDQWFLKTTAFAKELADDLDKVQWPEHVKTIQRNWIGRSEGAEIDFAVEKSQEKVTVFTTRPDTIFGVTALVLSPEHPLAEKLTVTGKKTQLAKYQKEVSAKTNIDRAQGKESEKTAFFTGSYAIHPLTNEKIPVWLADYVLMEYGTGAVMSVPAHDERDFVFAQTHHLPIKQVISPNLIQNVEPAKYRPSEPIKRGESVIVFIKHPTENKYLGLDWKESAWGAKTVLTGTIDDLSPEATLKKEIKEETGFQNFKVIQKLGVIDGLFYHLPKKTNKLVRGHVFLVQLKDEKKRAIEDHEQARHAIKWLTAVELKTFLTPLSHQLALGWLSGYQPYTELGALINSGEYDWLTSEEASKKIIAKLEERHCGRVKTTYRLRDWLVSRQRYWGAPIPIVYDPAGQPHPVKDEHLPLLLPTDVDFLPGGESPLARSAEYKDRAEKLYGPGWHFETDTLDTFVDSSWYFLRYLSPHDRSSAFRPELVRRWLPIDLYIGGIEHATLHLLYCRFVTKFLARYGYIDQSVNEPIKMLYNIGMITLHGAKMSKSKGNVISPDQLVEHYGTDALRGYELFVGPMDVEAEWNPRGINGIHRFLIKVNSVIDKLTENDEASTKRFEQYLEEIASMIKDFRLNTLISEAMKLINDWDKADAIDKDAYAKYLITLSPIFPFLAEELWHKLNPQEKDPLFKQARWPEVKEIQKTQDVINVLVNQKFVTRLTVEPQSGEEAVLDLARQNPVVAARLGNRKITRVIYQSGRLLNMVVGGK